MTTSNKFRTGGDDKHSTLMIKQFSEFDEGKILKFCFSYCLINKYYF